MSNSEDHYLFSVIVIQHNIGSLSKLDNPLSELGRRFLNRTAYPRLLSESLHALPNRTDSALRRFRALRSKKRMEAAYIEQCSLRPL
jgi:hypothetical protein